MKNNHYKENSWWASPYNDYPEVVETIKMAPKVVIHDATLRDGEQTPGVVFSIDDKIRIAEKLDEVGIERIEATMGCALPETIQYLVRKMKKLTGGIPVEVHTHNDFGMAVATELAGIAAGADVIHSCVNGLGERTGNAAAEGLMVAMKILLGTDNDYKLDKLMDLCQLVEKISGVPIATNKPIAGSRNYTRESGIGVDLVIKEPLAMFATDPRYFGREGDIVLGKKSGKASVEYFLDKLNIEVPGATVVEIVNQVKAKGQEKRGLLTIDEFKRIVDCCK